MRSLLDSRSCILISEARGHGSSESITDSNRGSEETIYEPDGYRLYRVCVHLWRSAARNASSRDSARAPSQLRVQGRDKVRDGSNRDDVCPRFGPAGQLGKRFLRRAAK